MAQARWAASWIARNSADRPLGNRTVVVWIHAGRLDSLLDLARRDEEGGLGDAPWPPHFPKAKGEPRRVSPSRARKDPPEE